MVEQRAVEPNMEWTWSSQNSRFTGSSLPGIRFPSIPGRMDSSGPQYAGLGSNQYPHGVLENHIQPTSALRSPVVEVSLKRAYRGYANYTA